VLKVVRHPPYQGGQGGAPRLSAPPLLRGQGGSEAKSIFYLIITTYLLHIPVNPAVSVGKFTRWSPLNPVTLVSAKPDELS
jgi:hypothetical protein